MALILEISASRDVLATVCAGTRIDQLASKITTMANLLISGSPDLPACYRTRFCITCTDSDPWPRNALDSSVELWRDRRHGGNRFLQDVRFELHLLGSNQKSRAAKNVIAVAEFNGQISSRRQGIR